jgi:hypothetical protein
VFPVEHGIVRIGQQQTAGHRAAVREAPWISLRLSGEAVRHAMISTAEQSL